MVNSTWKSLEILFGEFGRNIDLVANVILIVLGAVVINGIKSRLFFLTESTHVVR